MDHPVNTEKAMGNVIKAMGDLQLQQLRRNHMKRCRAHTNMCCIFLNVLLESSMINMSKLVIILTQTQITAVATALQPKVEKLLSFFKQFLGINLIGVIKPF
ncbi:hypothetical protein DAPPUDRAFT_320661 [Daphnia pulex]|uniref:Uncharacterized protein n=1 Tax=Daphnia pulex TaxID=6669 RepID=E9GQT2_DAPPU|nr:hypothetical protein DAPPUDRAFT_320661 [Daphnia pulex]|eukprot:EFX78279.1 hypothetical protein DAPPUDRAFT_320661 [Daphnia pulex]